MMYRIEKDCEENKKLLKGFTFSYKSFLISIILVLFTATSHAQEIKKIRITELEKYIKESDHPLIVNFWATFCVPCVKEIPVFQSVVAKYKGVELLLVSLDLPAYYPEKISSFAKEKNFTAGIVWLNETNADYFCPKIDRKWSGAIPSTLFVNNKTKYRRFYERELKEEEVEENIRTMIN